jgi:anaerobic magnesium-protoporphyrin IX monomethyl ester cyclase
MKILLFQAPFYVTEHQQIPLYAYANPEPNIGLSDLSAYLIAHGYNDVEIKNFCMDSWDVVTEHLKKYQSFGKSLIVGINCFSDTRYATFKLAQIAKKIIPECTTIVGGVHASILFENILKTNPSIDAIVVGEGEISLLEITKRTQRGEPLSEDIKGIAFRKNSKIVFTGQPELIKDLDDLPMTAHHLYDIEALRWNHDFNPLKNIAMNFILKDTSFAPKIWYMNTSRGCLGKCQFCTGNRVWEGKWRARSPQLVVDEIEYLHNHFGINLISFFDSCFITNRKRVKELCEEILRRELKIYWICLTRVDNIGDVDLLQIMRKAGCLGICFGIESGSPIILQNINKNCDISQAKTAIQMTQKAGIKAFTFYIVGNFGETDQTIRETIDFIKEVKSDILSIGYNMVYPGTELYEIAKSRGWIDDLSWDKFSYAPHFTYEHSYKKLTSYKNEILFAHFFSKLTSGDFSSLRLYFFTRSFLSYLTYKLKLGWPISFIKRLLNKKKRFERL